MPKETGRLTGERLFDCEICGFTYRFSETGLNRNNMRVCFEHCMDVGEWDPIFMGTISRRLRALTEYGTLVFLEEMFTGTATGEYGEVDAFDMIKTASLSGEFGTAVLLPDRGI